MKFLPGFHTTYPPCAAMPTSGNPSPSKSAMVGAPPMFDSTAQSEAVLAGSGMGFSSMPPVQSWMRKNPRLATTICGCLSSGRTPIGKPEPAKLAMAANPSGHRSSKPLGQMQTCCPDAVSGDLVDAFRCERLWAQRLSCRRVIDAVADHHLRALRVRQQARDGGTAPPYGRCRFTGLRVAAVQPEKVAVLVERDEAA